MNDYAPQTSLDNAKEILSSADAVLVLAGAGMSADSGLATYRGDDGQSQTDFVLEKLGMRYDELASFKSFRRMTKQVLGFYASRVEQYSSTQPHEGYGLLLNWLKTRKEGFFVATTNVDGAFIKSDYESDRIWEMHGSVFDWQCRSLLCSQDNGLHPVPDMAYNPKNLKIKKVPLCPVCKSELRPNVMMFNDGGWDDSKARVQESRCRDFLWFENYPGINLVVLEIGSGGAIPKLRNWSERLSENSGRTVIRINPEEGEAETKNIISVKLSAKEALAKLLG